MRGRLVAGCSKVKSNRWQRCTRRLLLLLRSRTRRADHTTHAHSPHFSYYSPTSKKKEKTSARYSHQLLPVRPSSSPFSEFHRNCFHPPSLSLLAGIFNGSPPLFFPFVSFFSFPPSGQANTPQFPTTLRRRKRHPESGTPAAPAPGYKPSPPSPPSRSAPKSLNRLPSGWAEMGRPITTGWRRA